MTFLHMFTIGFIAIGLFVLLSMKKTMENRVAAAAVQDEPLNVNQISTRPVIFWIWGSVFWAIISIFLIVLSFIE